MVIYPEYRNTWYPWGCFPIRHTCVSIESLLYNNCSNLLFLNSSVWFDVNLYFAWVTYAGSEWTYFWAGPKAQPFETSVSYNHIGLFLHKVPAKPDARNVICFWRQLESKRDSSVLKALGLQLREHRFKSRSWWATIVKINSSHLSYIDPTAPTGARLRRSVE